MRIALIDRSAADGRLVVENRFSGLAEQLRSLGHEVFLLDGPPEDDIATLPILTGLNRAIATRPLTDAYRLARHLADHRLDLVIAPLRGGIAQGILMARACGEAFAQTRVALWYDTPSRNQFLRSDEPSPGVAPFIADGLERQALLLADALLVPRGITPSLSSSIATLAPPIYAVSLPPSPGIGEVPELEQSDIREIVFVGPILRSAGVHEFIAAMERLSLDGVLADRTVAFLNPTRPNAHGVGRDWLGRRASAWSFKFKVIEEPDPQAIRRYLSDPGRLSVVVADDPEEFTFLSSCASRHLGMLRFSEDSTSLTNRLDDALRSALGNTATPPVARHLAADDWRELATKLSTLPVRTPSGSAAAPKPMVRVPLANIAKSSVDGTTVCVLHHNRLPELTAALASIPDTANGTPVEVIVIDNASDIPFVEDEIRARAGGRARLRIIRLAKPTPQASALNRGLAEAQFSTVLFLDDDNAYLPDGVARLARAVAENRFDIAVTALEVFENTRTAPGPTVGHLIFMGAAHSAGLFFNAFGDTTMAVRRDVFANIGGFHDPGYEYPGLDWVTLAKAQTAGLRIGALQWPAVRYRRDLIRAELTAKKLDQEGVRALVFEAYGGAFDGELLARYAQKLQLDEP